MINYHMTCNYNDCCYQKIETIFFSRFAGQTALDLARDPQMVQILSVKSVRRVQKTVNRLEGPLLRRSRFLGWRPVWVLKFK